MADEDADGMVTEDQLQEAIASWGGPLTSEEVSAWFDEMWMGYTHTDAAGNSVPVVDVWDFEAWFRDEEFKAEAARPTVGDLLRVALDTFADEDGNLDYWTVVHKIEDLLDQLAEDKKLTRSSYPDSLIEAWVKYQLNYIERVGYPSASVDQGVYAYTQGPRQPSSYDLLMPM